MLGSAWLGTSAACGATHDDAGTGASAPGDSGAAGKAAGGSGGHSDAGAPDAGAGGGCVLNGQHYASGARDIPSADGCNTCTCGNGTLACTEKYCPASDECVVAQNLADCCDSYQPVTRAALQADGCLATFPAWSIVDAALREACQKRSATNCAGVRCAQVPPPSRVAMSDGMGGCRYDDECLGTGDDCKLVRDVRQCCACTQSVPAKIVAADPCLVPAGSAAPEGCKACSAPVMCGSCPEPPAGTCEIRDSFSLCR